MSDLAGNKGNDLAIAAASAALSHKTRSNYPTYVTSLSRFIHLRGLISGKEVSRSCLITWRENQNIIARRSVNPWAPSPRGRMDARIGRTERCHYLPSKFKMVATPTTQTLKFVIYVDVTVPFLHWGHNEYWLWSANSLLAADKRGLCGEGWTWNGRQCTLRGGYFWPWDFTPFSIPPKGSVSYLLAEIPTAPLEQWFISLWKKDTVSLARYFSPTWMIIRYLFIFHQL